MKNYKMTKEEKKQFITNLCEGLKAETLNKVGNMPDHWDGWELRQYLADKAAEFVWNDAKQDKGRKRRYNNDIITKDL